MNSSLPGQGQEMPLQKCINGEDIKNLRDEDLLAVIVGTGTRKVNVMELSAMILRVMGGLSGIAASGIREMTTVPGLGIVKAIRLHCAIELGRRAMAGAAPVHTISTPGAVWRLLLPDMMGLDREKFISLTLNNKNRLIKKTLVSLGTVSEALVHPREVFREAIKEGGSSLIVAHNHPSGVLTPSAEDISTTARLAESGKLLGIPLLDHVIMAGSGYLSMKEEGYL
jgi:DNA repair protein RadC